MSDDISLKDSFNAMGARVQNGSVLSMHNGATWIYYDFTNRVRMTPIEGGHKITPFAELDREVLVAARDALIELGGKPPALPAEASTLNKPVRGLNP
ncbi:MAG: hypothetical protein JNM12_04125 [Alphaproteobacteria bacterium]|nr:hypothetical protein [Alphaproteobacteria bacterium]